MTSKDLDPRGLMTDAYAMPDLDLPQCRGIFLDWILGLPAERSAQSAIHEILAQHENDGAEHPMTAVLRDGLKAPASPRRRGGRSCKTKAT